MNNGFNEQWMNNEQWTMVLMKQWTMVLLKCFNEQWWMNNEQWTINNEWNKGLTIEDLGALQTQCQIQMPSSGRFLKPLNIKVI